jgi:ubiquinol-cytochrome c reductase iron-sulfur subunit
MTRMPAGTGTEPHAAVAAERRAERLVLLCFTVTVLAGLALLGLYIAGGQTQLEGILLMLCLGGLGAGIATWAHRLMPAGIHVEERHPLATSPEGRRQLDDALTAEAGFSRRTLLLRALAAAIGGLAAALAIPVFSLGPAPGRSLYQTTWRSGARLAPSGGQPVTTTSIPVDGVLTVFPDGDQADPNAAALLIHVEPELLDLPPERKAWAPNGFVCYSKICTHAGCPVGLYRAAQHTLICPCHQSQFAVLRGAVAISGPAARALPQLPIRLQDDGTFVALGDFDAPVGPSFWNIHR